MPGPSPVRLRALVTLEDAIARATELDTHLRALESRSRTRLALEMETTRARADQGDARAVDRLAELEIEKRELTDISVAHDLAARRALTSCQEITRALTET